MIAVSWTLSTEDLISMTNRGTHPDRVASRHGFSLVELLLVLVVLLCAATAVWPRLEAWRETASFEGCVDRVRNELQQARLTAIDSGQPVIVQHDVASGHLLCRTLEGASLRPPFALPPGVGLRSRDVIVEFRPDSTARSGSLTLFAEGGFAKELFVDRATGSVFVRDATRNGRGE